MAKKNLPDNLKNGIEALSGISLDNVKVHFGTGRPAELETDIHLAPDQEEHLPHEEWHVVQQKQGRVKPPAQLKPNAVVNEDPSLEKEADEMGAKAADL